MKVKKIIVILISIILLANCNALIVNAETLDQQKNNLTNQKKAVEAKQDEVQEEMSTQMQAVEEISKDISSVEDEISSLKSQLNEVESSIDEKEKEIEKKQKEYDSNQKLLADRMVAMYEAGETSFLDLLFSSNGIMDFISNYYLVEQIAEFDTELLENIEKEQKEIEEDKQELEEKKQEVEQIKSKQEAKSSELKTKKQEKQTKVNELSAEDKKLQSEIDSYNAQISKVEDQIADAWKKAQQQATSSGGGSSSGTAGLKFDGSFIWPCDNKIITSSVKWRWGRWHKGIDIGARYENVYASASGYAYRMENPGGYGHYIMIIHGSGYITLYGHLNSFKISNGQYVSQGQVIAQSGNSGGSQGAHLHFEIRKASSTSSFFSANFLNPLDYLPGGYTVQG